MQTSEDVGGSGGERIQPTTRDVRLAARARDEHGEIPGDGREAMLARLGRIVRDPKSPHRMFGVAIKTLAQLSGQNLRAVGVAIEAHAHEELQARMRSLEEWAAKSKSEGERRYGR